MRTKTIKTPLELTESDFQSMWEGSAQKSLILERNSQALNFGQSQKVSKDGEFYSLNAVYGETDLMYFRARYYSGELGRFVSRDPLGTSLDVKYFERQSDEIRLRQAFSLLPELNIYDLLKSDLLGSVGRLNFVGMQFTDGLSLYQAYFSVNGLDPTGKVVDPMTRTLVQLSAAVRAGNASQIAALTGALSRIMGRDASNFSEGFQRTIQGLMAALRNGNPCRARQALNSLTRRFGADRANQIINSMPQSVRDQIDLLPE